MVRVVPVTSGCKTECEGELTRKSEFSGIHSRIQGAKNDQPKCLAVQKNLNF